jgi:hypothetical protein
VRVGFGASAGMGQTVGVLDEAVQRPWTKNRLRSVYCVSMRAREAKLGSGWGCFERGS